MALGIASTALPFARTPEAILERWLRILRLHGEAGVALQALGVGEGRIEVPIADYERREPSAQADTFAGAAQTDAVQQVAEQAREIAGELGSELITTKHLLLALMRMYGTRFDHVLLAHGCEREELIERLGASFASC
jgi:ATP-dependent Clp protease ATP-binding subunit ClpA